jgi:flagella basal body P-ring formation protein FlgA
VGGLRFSSEDKDFAMNVVFLHAKRCWMCGVILAVVILMAAMETAQAATVSAGRIKEAVTRYVEKNSRRPAASVRVVFLSSVPDESLPVASSVQLEVSGRQDEDFIDYSTFVVGFYSDGALLKERSVSVSMEVLADVTLSARPLPRHRILAPGDLYVQKRWLKNIPANLAVLKESVGKALTMSIGANREITKNMLKEPALVKKGNPVRIVFDNDVLHVSVMGVSEEEGRKDQIIRVKNLASSRVIYAKVTCGDTVRVDF